MTSGPPCRWSYTLSFSTLSITSRPKVRFSPSVGHIFSVERIGKKKLKQVEDELKKQIKVQHDNLLSVFAVKLSSAYSEHDYPRLSILLEQRPSLSLHDVLEDCDFLREDRALVCCHLPHECWFPQGLFRHTSAKCLLVSAFCTQTTSYTAGYPRPVFTWPILSKRDNRRSSNSESLGTSRAF